MDTIISRGPVRRDTTLATDLNSGQRIQSLDILRGIIMVLMAVDHVRVYSGVPAGGPEAGVFFTRWITHFCAPGFAFLAGTSAFLYGARIADTSKLRRYLITRGIMLVALELTLIRFLWTFQLNFSEFILAGVIWMLGWCMVMLGILVRVSPRTLGIVGLTVIALQQLFGFIPQALPEPARATFGKFWEFVYPSGLESFASVSVLYSLVPWIGVMAAGYGFGTIVTMPPEKRRRICMRIGITAIAAFVVGGTAQILLTPSPEEAPAFIFRLLNQSKYPASQLFLLMTLGPIILLIPYAEKAKHGLARILAVIGRVPFFYYLLHILVIHVSALAVQLLRDGTTHPEWFAYAPYTSVPDEFRWSLPLLYAVFVADVVILYFACRWYAKYKSDHPEKKWLTFL